MYKTPISTPSCIVPAKIFDCFTSLTKEEAELLEKSKKEVLFKKGETITKQGAFASHIVYLNSGLAKVYLEGNQNDLILKIVAENNFLSLSSVFDGNDTFIYSVSAYVDSKVTLISIDVFKQLLRKNIEFSNQIINRLNANTAQIYGRVYCITRKQSHGRVADIILCLSENVFKTREFKLNISRNDLADLTGLSSESVIKIFKEFKSEKLINVEGKNIKILDYDKLEQISHYG
ncbi:MAG: Crp/Fnr family transcriptional regulator [Bacteroidales bacterium]|jgi:CRP-like cAMP-binding protein|nr:Crp/Fnr family transcriptional regulator [Bacteroidales bacterium]